MKPSFFLLLSRDVSKLRFLAAAGKCDYHGVMINVTRRKSLWKSCGYCKKARAKTAQGLPRKVFTVLFIEPNPAAQFWCANTLINLTKTVAEQKHMINTLSEYLTKILQIAGNLAAVSPDPEISSIRRFCHEAN